MDMNAEPIIHSHITDMLDDGHPLAFKTVCCQMIREHKCNEMLHAENNECMTTWVEFAGVTVCDKAFAMYILEKSEGVLSPEEFREYVLSK